MFHNSFGKRGFVENETSYKNARHSKLDKRDRNQASQIQDKSACTDLNQTYTCAIFARSKAHGDNIFQKLVDTYNTKAQEMEQIKGKSFDDWIVKLNSCGELVVQGKLKCGTWARSKAIQVRINKSIIVSKFGHVYWLIGNLNDKYNEVPEYIRWKFAAGFPEDWKTVVKTWRYFVVLSPNANSSSRNNASPSGTSSTYSIMTSRNLPSIANGESKSHDITRGKEIRKLNSWTPLMTNYGASKFLLVFRGSLLDSTYSVANEYHVTNVIYDRHSPTLVETVDHEFYQLIGGMINVDHEVPRSLVAWCRNGCPEHIALFCAEWKRLRPDEKMFVRNDQSPRQIHGECPKNLNRQSRQVSRYLNSRSAIMDVKKQHVSSNVASDVRKIEPNDIHRFAIKDVTEQIARVQSSKSVKRKLRTSDMSDEESDVEVMREENEKLNRDSPIGENIETTLREAESLRNELTENERNQCTNPSYDDTLINFNKNREDRPKNPKRILFGKPKDNMAPRMDERYARKFYNVKRTSLIAEKVPPKQASMDHRAMTENKRIVESESEDSDAHPSASTDRLRQSKNNSRASRSKMTFSSDTDSDSDENSAARINIHRRYSKKPRSHALANNSKKTNDSLKYPAATSPEFETSGHGSKIIPSSKNDRVNADAKTTREVKLTNIPKMNIRYERFPLDQDEDESNIYIRTGWKAVHLAGDVPTDVLLDQNGKRSLGRVPLIDAPLPTRKTANASLSDDDLGTIVAEFHTGTTIRDTDCFDFFDNA